MRTIERGSKKNTYPRPLGDRVLVMRDTPDEKTPGGILLPEAAKDKPKQGTVLALGSGRTLESGKRSEFSVAVNDRILFSAYAGTEVKVGTDTFLVMREEDILCVMSERGS